jgi:integrase
MRRDQPDKVILVCQWKGQADRFFGKFKHFETGKWVKIPGGVFPREFNTKEKALLFAEEWYAQAKADHEPEPAATKPADDPAWDAICDAYIAEVRARMRGKASTRHEAITVTNASIRRGILATGKPADNDESKCLLWLRSLAHENIAKGGAPPRTRKPMTVRNIAKHLRYLFKVALRKGLIPGMSSNPSTGDEFRDELKGLLATEEPREWLVPAESFLKLVTCAEVPTPRRIVYLALGLSGLRPGELAGLRGRHLRREGDVRFFSVEEQWALARSKGGDAGAAGIATLKTKWARRNVPAHHALRAALDEWIASGWEAWVGRAPTHEDFVFPDADGKAHREEHADTFRADLEAAGCPTSFAGEPLTPYALRHLFSTLLTEGHAHDAAHDRLMGHRPKDTKTLNYSAKLLPFLATEIERIAFELPATAPTFGAAPPARLVTSMVTEPHASELLAAGNA